MLRRVRAWFEALFPARISAASAPVRAGGSFLTVVLYTKRDCPLCETLKRELAEARVAPPFRLQEVDIEQDAELHARHGLSIPVLELEGRVLAKGRTTRAEFERRYARAVAEIRARSLLPGEGGRESRHG